MVCPGIWKGDATPTSLVAETLSKNLLIAYANDALCVPNDTWISLTQGLDDTGFHYEGISRIQCPTFRSFRDQK